jgi:hypothetical protein
MTLPIGIQDAAVALLALAALAWLVLRNVRRSRKGADAACESCPAAAPVAGVRPAPQPDVLLAIGEPQSPPASTPR